jgi:exodeoxyribonuclease VII small subunit
MVKRNPAPEPAGGDGEEGPGFEEALERLETIVEELEGGALSLEQSIARYEEGVKLSRRLTQTLDRAEKRIERLTEIGGEPTTVPADVEDSAEETEARPQRPPERPAQRSRPQSPPPADELPF